MKQKGITLVALVVTIIILLILAGVTIAQITGNEGLFNRVRKAVSQYEDAQEKEDIGITNLETMLGEERENSKQLEEPTANPADVLEGKSYYDKNKEPQEGAMTNNGAVNATIEPGGKPYTIPEGYHNGEGTVKANEKENKGVLVYQFAGKNFARSATLTDMHNSSINMFDTSDPEIKVESDFIEPNQENTHLSMRCKRSGIFMICWYRWPGTSSVTLGQQLFINGDIKATGTDTLTFSNDNTGNLVWTGNLNEGDIINLKGSTSTPGYTPFDAIYIFSV